MGRALRSSIKGTNLVLLCLGAENKVAGAPSYIKQLIVSQITTTVVWERHRAAAGSRQPPLDENELRLKKAT